MSNIYRHADTVCPHCGHRLNALAQVGGVVEPGTPTPGDLSVCIACLSVLELTMIGGYRVMHPDEVAALSDDARIDLEATQAMLAMYDSWRQTQGEGRR